MAAALHALLPHEPLHAAALIRDRYASQVQLSSTMYCAPARPRWRAQHLSSQLVTSCAQHIRRHRRDQGAPWLAPGIAGLCAHTK